MGGKTSGIDDRTKLVLIAAIAVFAIGFLLIWQSAQPPAGQNIPAPVTTGAAVNQSDAIIAVALQSSYARGLLADNATRWNFKMLVGPDLQALARDKPAIYGNLTGTVYEVDFYSNGNLALLLLTDGKIVLREFPVSRVSIG